MRQPWRVTDTISSRGGWLKTIFGAGPDAALDVARRPKPSAFQAVTPIAFSTAERTSLGRSGL